MNADTLVIVDMLNDFIDPQGVLYCGETAQAIVPHIEACLMFFRRTENPVIFLQDAHAPDDKAFDKFPPHCIAGTWGSRIIEVLAPQPGEHVLAKTRYSGFYGTSLDRLLPELRSQKVDVVGVCTSICVMDTVGGLVNRDYAVRVHRNGVADFDPQAHAYALNRMQKIYGAEII